MQEHVTQVIIAGGGPTGLMLANQLERFGIDYILVDQKPAVVPESRAMTVQARTLEFMDQLGLVEKFLAQGKPTTHAEIYVDNRHAARIDFGSKYEGVETPYPYVLNIEQNKTEQILLDNLQRRDSIWFETALVESGQTPEHAWIVVENEHGRQKITGRYLVACDGSHSRVREQAGMEFVGKRYPTLFLVMDSYGRLEPELEGIMVSLRHNSLALAFNLSEPGKFRTFVTLPDTKRYEETPETAVALTKPEFPDGFEVDKVAWFSYYKVACKMLDDFRKDRIFFAGDAAHTHSPAGGQGMNTGLGDAVNLGWKLAYTLNYPETYPAESDLLATYSLERTRFAKGLLRTTDKLFSAVVTPGLGSRLVIGLFPTLFRLIGTNSALQTLFFSRISQLTINHRASALSKGRCGHLRGGDRLPYFEYTSSAGTPTNSIETMRERNYHVFSFGNTAPETTVPFSHIGDEATLQRYNLPRGGYIIVRPDMYIQDAYSL